MIDKEIAIQFLTESDLIEGIEIDRQEYDKCLLRSKGKKHSYVNDHVKAFRYVCDYVEDLPQIIDILNLHKLLMWHDPKHTPGKFRVCDVKVGETVCPSHILVENLMEKWVSDLHEDNKHPEGFGNIELSYHKFFECVHPFSDGNGRTGRLLWLWHRVHNKKAINTFLNTEYSDFFQNRYAYYHDLKTFRSYPECERFMRGVS
jgi:Fic family protein